MASRYSERINNVHGISVTKWFETYFLSKSERLHGPDIPGIGPFNSTLLVIHDRIELNDQASKLYDQGSKSPSGKIYGFADAELSFLSIFTNEFEAKNRLRNAYALPLVQSSEDCEALWVWISDCAVNFVSGKKGNNAHSDTHVATAYSSVLAAICYQLAESLSLSQDQTEKMGDTNGPDLLTGDAERHMLYDSLEWVTRTIRALVDYSPQVRSIFETLTMAFWTPDTLQSLNATHILGTMNSERVIAHWIFLSYRRYLTHSSTTSFLTDFPVGLTALMVVSPMIFRKQEKTGWAERLEQIMKSIDRTMSTASVKFLAGDIATQYDLRVSILQSFAKESGLIDDTLIPKICEAMENDKSFESVIHCPKPDWIFDSTPMINQRPIGNPIYIQELDSDLNSIRVMGSDPTNWSAICLRPGVKVRVKIHSLGYDAKIGNTAGKGRVQNVRFGSTFDPNFMDIMKGQKGVSTSGQVYHPTIDRFMPHVQPRIVIPSGEWMITSTRDGLTVECNDRVVMQDNEPYFPSEYDGPEHTNADRYPLIAFKNCYLVLNVVDRT